MTPFVLKIRLLHSIGYSLMNYAITVIYTPNNYQIIDYRAFYSGAGCNLGRLQKNKMKVLITSDSHTGALKHGQNLLTSRGRWPQQVDLTIQSFGNGKFLSTPFFIDKGDYAEICNPEYQQRFERFPPIDLENSDVIYGLSVLFHTAGLRRHNAWAEFAPSLLAFNTSPISNTLLRQAIKDRTQYFLKFIGIILHSEKKFFVIVAPKPFRHATALKLIKPEVLSYIDGYIGILLNENSTDETFL